MTAHTQATHTSNKTSADGCARSPCCCMWDSAQYALDPTVLRVCDTFLQECLQLEAAAPPSSIYPRSRRSAVLCICSDPNPHVALSLPPRTRPRPRPPRPQRPYAGPRLLLLLLSTHKTRTTPPAAAAPRARAGASPPSVAAASQPADAARPPRRGDPRGMMAAAGERVGRGARAHTACSRSNPASSLA